MFRAAFQAGLTEGWAGAILPPRLHSLMAPLGQIIIRRAARPPSQTDARNVACHRRDESNLAVAYIELRQLARSMWEGPITDEEQDRLKAVLQSNDR